MDEIDDTIRNVHITDDVRYHMIKETYETALAEIEKIKEDYELC